MVESPYARYVLPALVGILMFGALLIFITSGGQDGAASSISDPPAAASSKSTSKSAGSKRPKTVTVRAGDTPTAIAGRAGIALEQLLALNPKLDPRTLRPGQKLKLAR